jgi:hypothetical protein
MKMAIMKKTEIILDHKFDPKTCRHTLNGAVSVLHCHHYADLYSQLANDCGMLDGKKLLAECAEDCFMDILASYYSEYGVTDIDEKIAIAEQYYAATGLGQMKVLNAGPESGEVELIHSHVDEGWMKKWGKYEKPVNFITCGYIAGIFNAIFDLPTRTFSVTEEASIVAGAERSQFKVVIN